MANLNFFEMKFGDYSSFFQRKEKLYSSNNVDLKDLLWTDPGVTNYNSLKIVKNYSTIY